MLHYTDNYAKENTEIDEQVRKCYSTDRSSSFLR